MVEKNATDISGGIAGVYINHVHPDAFRFVITGLKRSNSEVIKYSL